MYGRTSKFFRLDGLLLFTTTNCGACLFLSSEDVIQKTWDIEEITERFQRPDTGEKIFWKVSFRERDDIPEDIFKRTGFKEITEDNEYISRYDLTYLTPCFYQLRCKVSANNSFLFTFYNRRVCYARLFLFYFEYCLRLIPFFSPPWHMGISKKKFPFDEVSFRFVDVHKLS